MIAPPLTWLYVPGDRPDRFAKALATETDVVIIDLEDAVAAAHKDAARANSVAFLNSPTPKPVVVRINGLRTPWGAADCAALTGAAHLAGVYVPKVESAEDVQNVRAALGGRPVPLHCLIETARGVEAALTIASAGRYVGGIALGEADLRSDLGVGDEEGLLWSRSRLVVAARAAGLPAPAMSVYPHVDDPEGLAASCRRGRALGFVGRTAIHPRQLPVIVAAFLPTDAEVAAARELLDAVDAAERAGSGVTTLPDGRFADRAMVEGARRVIALSQRA